VGLARSHALDDDLAGVVYARYPDLIRGPFRANVTPTWWRGYPNLVQATQVAGDEDLLDTLASRYATRIFWKWGPKKEMEAPEKAIPPLAPSYQPTPHRDAAASPRRAANVLTRIPAYATFNQGLLLRGNDLARLLFVRSLEQYLAVPEAVQDLVEGSNIH